MLAVRAAPPRSRPEWEPRDRLGRLDHAKALEVGKPVNSTEDAGEALALRKCALTAQRGGSST